MRSKGSHAAELLLCAMPGQVALDSCLVALLTRLLCEPIVFLAQPILQGEWPVALQIYLRDCNFVSKVAPHLRSVGWL